MLQSTFLCHVKHTGMSWHFHKKVKLRHDTMGWRIENAFLPVTLIRITQVTLSVVLRGLTGSIEFTHPATGRMQTSVLRSSITASLQEYSDDKRRSKPRNNWLWRFRFHRSLHYFILLVFHFFILKKKGWCPISWIPSLLLTARWLLLLLLGR